MFVNMLKHLICAAMCTVFICHIFRSHHSTS